MRDSRPANPRQVGQTSKSDFCYHRGFDQPLDCLMRNLRQLDRICSPSARPKGLSFAIADLARAQCWAAMHGWRIHVRLDHGMPDEEYEEVIELQSALLPRSKTIIWRNTRSVFLQPLPGKRQRYHSVQAALEGLRGSQRSVAVSEIVATTWSANTDQPSCGV